MALSFLPVANFAKSLPPAPVVPRATLAATATPTSTTQATLSGINQVLRVIYGRDRVGAYIVNAVTSGGYTYIQAAWAYGECDAVESITHGDEALPGAVTVTTYLGTTGQTYDTGLAAAFAAQSPAITYADNLPGICYSVLKVPSSTEIQWQALNAVIRGRKVTAPHARAIDSLITYTRTGPKTYYDATGTLQTAADNVWPVEYDPATGACLGRSVWESSQNLLTHSESATGTNVLFGGAGGSCAASPFTDPAGNNNATRATMSAGAVYAYRSATVSGATAGRIYTGSFWAKTGATGIETQVRIGEIGGAQPAAFSNSGFVAIAQNGEWTRFSLSRTIVENDRTAIQVVANNKDAADTQLDIFGWQCEQKAFPTPYIPTTTAAVTRGAETPLIDGADFSEWYNQSEGTFVVEGRVDVPLTGTRYFVATSDGTLNERTELAITNANTRGFSADGGATQADISSAQTITQSSFFAAAVAYKANDFGVASHGVAETPDLACTTPTVDRLYLGVRTVATGALNGYIRRLTYYPTRIANADLQALSATADGYTKAGVAPSLVLDLTDTGQVRVLAEEWTQNPVACLGDFLESTTYGAARTVDWAAAVPALNACDYVLADSNPARALNLSLDTPQRPADWIDTLRTYARCWVVLGDNGLQLIADDTASSVASYAHASGQIARIGPIKKRGLRDAPTAVSVIWTDISALPYRERTETATLPSWLGEARTSEVRLPGIRTASQAAREAAFRLNKLTTSDLSFDLDVFDSALAHEVGDVVTVTHPVGLTAKAMRIAEPPQQTAPGRWRLALVEYDAAAYGTAIVTEPTSDDTTLPSPANPQAVASLSLAEEVFQQLDGTYSSRLRATWTADTQPRLGYRYELRAVGVVVSAGAIARNTSTWASPAVQEAVLHTLDVWTVGILGNESSAAQATYTPAGKSLIPGDVATLSGFEVGGNVRLSWTAAVDVDIWRYEVRYSLTSETWADATLIDRVDALRLVTSDIPEGTWRFYVKAIDSIGQYSTNAAARDITVTSDADAFLAGDYDLTTATLSNMHTYNLGRTDAFTRYVTDDGVAAATAFPTSPASTYGNVAASYAAAASSITLPSASTGQDFGQELSGNWSAELTVADIAGTSTSELGLSTDGISFTDYSAMVAKTTARYARVKASGSSGTVFRVTVPVANLRIDAVTRNENGSGTSSASTYTRITLTDTYSAAQAIVITPTGTAARTPVIDNVTVGSPTTFDVYLFDSAGSQVASGFLWAWKGV